MVEWSSVLRQGEREGSTWVGDNTSPIFFVFQIYAFDWGINVRPFLTPLHNTSMPPPLCPSVIIPPTSCPPSEFHNLWTAPKIWKIKSFSKLIKIIWIANKNRKKLKIRLFQNSNLLKEAFKSYFVHFYANCLRLDWWANVKGDRCKSVSW